MSFPLITTTIWDCSYCYIHIEIKLDVLSSHNTVERILVLQYYNPKKSEKMLTKINGLNLPETFQFYNILFSLYNF